MDWLSLSLSSQDSLSNDAYEAVWPLSFHSLLGPPLGSRPSCQGEGAQVSTAAQVQQAWLSLQGQHMGLGSAGLWWGHYLFKETGACDGFFHVLLIRLQNGFYVLYKFMDVWSHAAGGLLQEPGH